MNIDSIGYFLKLRVPFLYAGAEKILGWYTYQSNRRQIKQALKPAKIVGKVGDRSAVVRPLEPGDIEKLLHFFSTIPESHLKFFKPHGFERKTVESVLKKQHYLTYGLLTDDVIVGYGILKLFIGKKTFRGRLVSPDWSGFGLGKYLSKYLSWQVGLLGFKARSTISRQNIKSLKTHEVEGAFDVIGELPNDYMLIEFHDSKCAAKPDLSL